MGIDSNLGKAGAPMPQARWALMHTPMDLVNRSLHDIRAAIKRIASEYGPCDIVLTDIESDPSDEQVAGFVEVCEGSSNRHNAKDHTSGTS